MYLSMFSCQRGQGYQAKARQLSIAKISCLHAHYKSFVDGKKIKTLNVFARKST